MIGSVKQEVNATNQDLQHPATQADIMCTNLLWGAYECERVYLA